MTQNSLLVLKFAVFKYRARNKGMHILLSNSQAGPGRTVKQEQEEISRNHVQTFISPSVLLTILVKKVNIQSREKVLVRGCEKFLPALA